VIPAVDVLEGRAVRLRQGRFSERFLDGGDPTPLLAGYAAAGATLIHLVDLDGARRGTPDLELIERAVAATPGVSLQVGGGIRSTGDADRVLSCGGAGVVMGTAALESRITLEEIASALGDRLVVAIDARGGEVLSHAWLQTTGREVLEVARACEDAGVKRVLCTAVERDGTHRGPDLELLGSIARSTGMKVIASGGVGSEEDLASLDALGIEACVVGRAFLDGSLALSVLGG